MNIDRLISILCPQVNDTITNKASKIAMQRYLPCVQYKIRKDRYRSCIYKKKGEIKYRELETRL